MKFSEEAERRLQAWAGRSTWHTGHHTDQHEFYKFVRALWECNRTLIDEGELRERILEAVMRRGDWDREAAKDYIFKHRYANLAQQIMDYHLANED